MKIGINGRFLQYPYTGIGQYTIQLLREFSKMKRERRDEVHHLDFVIAVPNEQCIEQMQLENIDLPAVVIPEKEWLGKSLGKHWWEQVQVPGFFHEQKVNVIWLPYPCVRWFKKSADKTIVTVHDTIPWTSKKYQRRLFSRLAHRMSRVATSQADHIITVSETSAKNIMWLCGIPEKNITVIENGVSEIFHKLISQDVMSEVLGKFGLQNGKFFLYVGGYDARKNVKLMVESYRKYCESHTCEYPLVLVGGKSHEDSLYADFDGALTEPENSRTVIKKTGFLSDTDLAALYQASRGFVHFSSQEGFNIPLAQAMVSHLPLLISDTDIHHEIAGDDAIYVQTEGENSLEKGWDTLIHSQTHTLSKDYSHRFSWDRSAHAHLRTFKRISL
ncbi:MAG: glycosyltransferase family 1 protein [Candidatus Peregrinibacteria bacterium]|nr:glycosyltransferase family 1 protein [Candidatus Peregrinibacteria bacterium]